MSVSLCIWYLAKVRQRMSPLCGGIRGHSSLPRSSASRDQNEPPTQSKPRPGVRPRQEPVRLSRAEDSQRPGEEESLRTGLCESRSLVPGSRPVHLPPLTRLPLSRAQLSGLHQLQKAAPGKGPFPPLSLTPAAVNFGDFPNLVYPPYPGPM